MIYTACKYVPEEMFAGFGETCERLDPNPVSFSCADGCAHPNLCGFAKAVIEEVEARDVRALILTDCCDAMRRTADVLAEKHLDFFYFLPLPHKNGEPEIRLFARELGKLAAAAAKYTGKPFSWKMALEACLLHNAGTEDVRNGSAGSVNAGQTESCAEEERRTGEPSSPIVVTGAHGGHMLLEQIRELCPGVPVTDDTCSGNRVFRAYPSDPADIDSEEQFFAWYARLLLTGLKPCMRMCGAENREGLLRSPLSAAEGNAENMGKAPAGIIYHTIKFCDYYSFEYADLKDRSSVTLLKIETDTTPQSSGQMKTRIEAFAETVGVNMNFRQKKTDPAANGGGFYAAGIDSGSTSTDVVIMDANRKILGSAICPTGMSASRSAEEALQSALKEAGLERSRLSGIVATGYGRDIIDLEKQTVTEITCHAKGAQYLFPGVHTIIDIGGQDSKVIRIDEKGQVQQFVMNDKCAAGTGRFLEMQARALGLTMEEMSRLGLHWKEDIRISNMCTVFAESEVVSLVAKDTAPSDIIHGLNQSVAAKTMSLVKRGKGEPDYAMTGGVSRNEGVVQCLTEALGCPVRVSDQSQLCGAIGAALMLIG